MQLLTYFNISSRTITSVIEPTSTYLKAGDFYKTNNMLVSKIDIKKQESPLKICKKKFKGYRYKIGETLVDLGNYVVNGKKPRVEYKYKYPWWKR